MLMLIAVWAVVTLVCTLGALLLLALDERQVAARTPAAQAPVAAPAPAPVPVLGVPVPA